MQKTHIRNRYELLKQLGQGGMGVVYQAYDRLRGEMVALKQVINIKGDVDDPLQLAHEFKLLASLRHPNIISVLDYGFDEDGVPFFTMTLLERHQPITEAAQGLTIEQRIELLIQFFEALAYLHRRRILHRDLKPNNVLVMPNGIVKVVDFGVAMVDRQARTRVAGTILYLPPEVLRDDPPTPLSDLYSAGVLSYEVLTGHHPYDYDSVTDLLSAILGTDPDLKRLPAITESDLHETIQLVKDAHIDIDFFPTGKLDDLDSRLNPLQVIMQRLMEKDPKNRYQHATIVIDEWRAALGRPPAQETAAVRDSYLQAAEFVGRADELDTLLVGLEGIMSAYPRGRAFLIGGESGVGKSRLLDEFRVRAMVSGAEVVIGRGAATGGTRYNYWSEAVRRLVMATPISDVEAGILQEVIPDIATLIGRTVPPAPPADGPSAQSRLKEMIVTLFQRQAIPTVLILEDLHWAVESLTPLKDLAETVHDYPLLIVGSYRNDERPNLPAELPTMELITLTRFDTQAIKALSSSMLGEVGQRPDVLSFIQRETEGNAYFIIETMRTLAAEAGRLRDVGRLPLPESIQAGGIQAILQRRLESVPPDSRPLLNVAAVQARQFNLEVLKKVAADNHILPENLELWLSTCADAAVIEMKDGNWQFVHDKLRMALVESIADDQRRRLHRQVAEAMESIFADLEKNATPLLRQWRAAGDVGKEVYYTLIAARQNFAASEFAVAIRQAQRVLDVLPNTPEHSIQRVDAMHILGVALSESGEREASIPILTEALAKSRQLSNDRLIILSLTDLGAVLQDIDRAEEAMTYLNEAVQRAGVVSNLALMAGALNGLGAAHLRLQQFDAALPCFERSVALCRSIGFKWGIARALNNMGNAYIAQDKPDDAKPCYLESLDLWRELGSQSSIAKVINNLGAVTETLGQFDEAATYYAEGLRLSREHNDSVSMTIALLNLAWSYLMLNRSADATPHLREALRRAVTLNNGLLLLYAVLGLIWVNIATDAFLSAQWFGMALQHPDADSNDYHFSDVEAVLRRVLEPLMVNEAIASGSDLDFDTVVETLLNHPK